MTKRMDVNNDSHQLFVIQSKSMCKSNFNPIFDIHLKCDNIHIFE